MNFVRNLAVSALLLGALIPARAADLPSGPPARAPIAYTPAFSWTGFYAGLNAGYGWGTASDPTGALSTDLDGALAGGQIGANYQVGNWVFGVEGDIQATWQKETVAGTIAGVAFSVERELPWFATARARFGYAWDRHLLYVTGGGAWLNYKVTATVAGVSASSEDTVSAWTAGGGWEWRFTDRVSSKVEYLYMDTGDTSVTLFNATINGSGNNHVVRAGINFYF